VVLFLHSAGLSMPRAERWAWVPSDPGGRGWRHGSIRWESCAVSRAGRALKHIYFLALPTETMVDVLGERPNSRHTPRRSGYGCRSRWCSTKATMSGPSTSSRCRWS
jgi:hypothetical protein